MAAQAHVIGSIRFFSIQQCNFHDRSAIRSLRPSQVTGSAGLRLINKADTNVATTGVSPSVSKRECLEQANQVSDEPISADRCRRGYRHRVIVNMAKGLR
jgi:hypothetical protein